MAAQTQLAYILVTTNWYMVVCDLGEGLTKIIM